jgi:hypothetical protein
VPDEISGQSDSFEPEYPTVNIGNHLPKLVTLKLNDLAEIGEESQVNVMRPR